MEPLTEFVKLKDLLHKPEKKIISEKGYLNLDEILWFLSNAPDIKKLFIFLYEKNKNGNYNTLQTQLIDLKDSNSKKPYQNEYAQISKNEAIFHFKMNEELRNKIIAICTDNLLSKRIYYSTKITIENSFEANGQNYTFNEKLQQFNGRCLAGIEIPKMFKKKRIGKNSHISTDVRDAFFTKIEELGYKIKLSDNGKENAYFFKPLEIDNPDEVMDILARNNNMYIDDCIRGTDSLWNQMSLLKYSGNILVCSYNIYNERYYEDKSIKNSYRDIVQFSGEETLYLKKSLTYAIKNIISSIT